MVVAVRVGRQAGKALGAHAAQGFKVAIEAIIAGRCSGARAPAKNNFIHALG